MSEENILEDDASEMIGESIQEQQELDTIRKLENREEHSVLEASLVKGEPLYPHELSSPVLYDLSTSQQHVHTSKYRIFEWYR